MALLRPVSPPSPHQPHGAGERCPACDQPIPIELSEEVRSRIADREQRVRASIEEQLARDKAAAEARANAAIEVARREAEAAIAAAREEARAAAEAAQRARLEEAESARRTAEAEVMSLRERQEALVAERIGLARESLEKEKLAAIQAEQARAFDEKQKFQSKIAELQRQLENKTSQDLGEGPEADLFELLKAEFPEDRITRVEKGAAGADVIQDINHNGRPCGRIVYDSKNRSAWRNEYVSKLRADQIDAKADHAVLASKVFPAGVRELHIQDGVLVAAPGRVLVLSHLLRKHVVQTHALRAGNEARAQKTEALYAFIMSERCTQLLGTIDLQAGELVELDRKEERAHQATWKKRAELIRSVQRAHGDITFEIDRIIGVAGNHAPGEDAV
jgi:hypothetical protein